MAESKAAEQSSLQGSYNIRRSNQSHQWSSDLLGSPHDIYKQHKINDK